MAPEVFGLFRQVHHPLPVGVTAPTMLTMTTTRRTEKKFIELRAFYPGIRSSSQCYNIYNFIIINNGTEDGFSSGLRPEPPSHCGITYAPNNRTPSTRVSTLLGSGRCAGTKVWSTSSLR